jgi:hypothetical protein
VVRRSGRDLSIAGIVLGWIGAILLADAIPGLRGDELALQLVLAVLTWLVLAGLLARESALVRVQTLLVVALASLVEYTFSPLLGAYVYRLGTVPGFVPPGHGLVYLAALALGRSPLLRAHSRLAVSLTVLAGGSWAAYGLLLADRRDVLGAFWFGCLLGFLLWGRARLLYVGAFVVVSYLELVGTALGTWAWQPTDPILHLIGQGNPPSGAAGGYGWFDLYAGLLAPVLIARWARWRGQEPDDDESALRVASCSKPLVATALPPNGPSTPSSEVNRPPASTTIGTSAAMSYNASSGSQARSTAPSATSMYDQKSP